MLLTKIIGDRTVIKK